MEEAKTSHPLKAEGPTAQVQRSPNRMLGKVYVPAHRGQDARVCPSEQSHPRAKKNKCKTSQAMSQRQNAVIYLEVPGVYQSFQAISYVLILLGSGMPVTKSISGFFGE
jgi:hypothetical protein